MLLNRTMALTKSDLNKIDVLIDSKLDEKLDEKLTQLKSDIFERIDPILKEVTTAREERPLVENRLGTLEEIHPKGKHVFAS